MTSSVILDDAGVLDLDDVMAVMDESFDPAFGEAWTAPQCAGLLPMRGVWLTVARQGDETIGFALARAVVDEAELLLLAVRPGARRSGTGTMLVDRFEAEAEARGARRMHLEVRDGNHAVKLYNKRGFLEVGRRKNYYRGLDGSLHNALTLAKMIKR